MNRKKVKLSTSSELLKKYSIRKGASNEHAFYFI